MYTRGVLGTANCAPFIEVSDFRVSRIRDPTVVFLVHVYSTYNVIKVTTAHLSDNTD